MTAAISPGSSGGAVINQHGQVLGVAVGSREEGQSLNFMIPAIQVARLLRALPDNNTRTSDSAERVVGTITLDIDPTTGLIAVQTCPLVQSKTFPIGQQPTAYCGPEHHRAQASSTDALVKSPSSTPQSNTDFSKLLQERRYSDAFAVGKQKLAKNPDDLKTLIGVSWIGMYGTLTGKRDLAADAQTYTKKTIDLINAGKTPDPNGQFANKDETLGWLNYALGYYNLKNAPSEAANYLYKSASYEGSSKKDPQTYAWLAAAYQSGDYNRLSKEYTDKCAGKAENPECKAMLETVNQLIDKIIDAYARAIAYAKVSADPSRYTQAVGSWQKDLTDFYKFRHNDSEAGLSDFIATVIGTPIPYSSYTVVYAQHQTRQRLVTGPQKSQQGVQEKEQRRRDEESVREMRDSGADLAFVVSLRVNIQEEPKSSSRILKQVERGEVLALVEREPVGTWYKVIHVDSAIEGWVEESGIVIKLTASRYNAPPLEKEETGTNQKPELSVSNLETSTDLNLRINGTLYIILANSKKTFTLDPGRYEYYGWSPGVRPAIGGDDIRSGVRYSWTFKIVRH